MQVAELSAWIGAVGGLVALIGAFVYWPRIGSKRRALHIEIGIDGTTGKRNDLVTCRITNTSGEPLTLGVVNLMLDSEIGRIGFEIVDATGKYLKSGEAFASYAKLERPDELSATEWALLKDSKRGRVEAILTSKIFASEWIDFKDVQIWG